MTEHLRRDPSLNPDLSTTADPNLLVPERQVVNDADSRPLVTPPPGDVRASSVASGATTGAAAARAPEEERAALFAGNEANELRARWDSIQVGFVDEPRKAVQEADALVSSTIKRLSEVFANERQNLEQQWGRNDNVSTEDLRVALRRYRSFFSRLLAI
ncbi:MAG TPA: hypothetical protein VOA88_03595 [Candidatus Dormibacteraeota bacterium]|nr:hypothetical protein [Candidatus Dormibacteraeota bacterium]